MRVALCGAPVPGHETIRADENGAVAVEACRVGPAPIDVLEIAGGLETPAHDPERGGASRPSDDLGPSLTLGSAEEHPLAGKEVDGRHHVGPALTSRYGARDPGCAVGDRGSSNITSASSSRSGTNAPRG